jgi:hypothetical protein
MTRSASFASFLFFAFAATATACSSAPTSDLADENVATGAAALSTSIGTTGLSSISSNDPSAAATAAAEDKDGDECRTRTIDPAAPNVVHVVLKDCTGRLGRHHVSGNITITFSANADGSLHAEHQSQIDSKITNFITCEGPSDVDSCPTGTIQHDNPSKQRTVTEIFDGSNIASVQIVKPKGETTRQVTLNCGPTSQVGQ